MRVRLPLGRSLFFVLAFLFALVALLPLRLALDWLSLDERGFAAREARGSIWLGALGEAQLGSVPLGDLSAQLRSLPLFVGRARVELARDDEADPFRGGVTVSRHGFGIDDVTGDLDIGSVFTALPLGAFEMQEVSARFEDGACSSAEGRVSAILSSDVAGIALPGGLRGNARCDEGALLLPLVSQSGMEALNLRLFDDGRYAAELVVRPTDDALRQRLAAAGFVASGNGYALALSGEF